MTRGLLIQQFAGCKILQDSFSDEYRYRVVTDTNRCILETGNISEATETAEQISKAYTGDLVAPSMGNGNPAIVMQLKPNTWYWFDWDHNRPPTIDEIPAEMHEFPPSRRSGISYVMTDANGKIRTLQQHGDTFSLNKS